MHINILSRIKHIDDLDMVGQTLEEIGFMKDQFYIHCDGDLFGLMMPFVKWAPKASFKNPIGSVSVFGIILLDVPFHVA